MCSPEVDVHDNRGTASVAYLQRISVHCAFERLWQGRKNCSESASFGLIPNEGNNMPQ